MNDLFSKSSVVPVVVIEDAAKAIPVARALVAGGLPVIEVTLRTAAGIDAIRLIAAEVPEAIVGAGTVLSVEQARSVAGAGAKFIVSPGLYEPVVAAASELGITIVPGVSSATEAQRAWNLGLRVLKFFPAGLSGGIPMLKAFAAVFGDLSFMPTGGVSAKNLHEYLQLPSVVGCGGSWLTPAAAIEAGDYEKITALASEALSIAKKVRG